MRNSLNSEVEVVSQESEINLYGKGGKLDYR